MYIYFDKLNYVLTCHEFPELISVDEMKKRKMEEECNRWEKKCSKNGSFTLSFSYIKYDNSQYEHITKYNNFFSRNQYSVFKSELYKYQYNTNLYLQNSGDMDVLQCKPQMTYANYFYELPDYPNIIAYLLINVPSYGILYHYINESYDKTIFALHIKNNRISDSESSEIIKKKENNENFHIIFIENV